MFDRYDCRNEQGVALELVHEFEMQEIIRLIIDCLPDLSTKEKKKYIHLMKTEMELIDSLKSRVYSNEKNELKNILER